MVCATTNQQHPPMEHGSFWRRGHVQRVVDPQCAGPRSQGTQAAGLPPSPPEVEASSCEEDRIAQKHGIHIAPEARKRMAADDLTLQYFYEGKRRTRVKRPKGSRSSLSAGTRSESSRSRPLPDSLRASGSGSRRCFDSRYPSTIDLVDCDVSGARWTSPSGRIRALVRSFLIDSGTEMTSMPASAAKIIDLPIFFTRCLPTPRSPRRLTPSADCGHGCHRICLSLLLPQRPGQPTAETSN